MIRRATWILGPILALGSCQLERELNPVVGPGELQTGVVQFSDLPVPRELQLRSGVDQSWSWQRGAFRTANLEYEGEVLVDDVRAFLRNRLPSHGWRLVEEEHPTRERVEQRWLSDAQPGVQYLLDVALLAEGARSRLHYHLWTRRDWTGSVKAVEAMSPERK